MRTICFVECPTVDELLAPWQEVPLASIEGEFIILVAEFFGTHSPTSIHKMLFPMFDASNNVAHGEVVYLLSYPENGDRALISKSEEAIVMMNNLMYGCGMCEPTDIYPKVAYLDMLVLDGWKPQQPRITSNPRIMVNASKQE